MEVIEMQAVLESYVVRQATPQVTDLDLEQLSQILTQAEDALAQGD